MLVTAMIEAMINNDKTDFFMPGRDEKDRFEGSSIFFEFEPLMVVNCKVFKVLIELLCKFSFPEFLENIQENIQNSKEEQYQGEFLIDLFVNVLGYTKNPTPDFNLTTELKNIKGSKKI